MRIRKRWPLSTHPPPLSSSPSSPPPPPLTVTPDLPSKTALDLQSSSQSGGGLNRAADPSVVQSPPQPRDSPNPPLPERHDLQITILRGTNGWICAGTEGDVKPENNKGDFDCFNCMHPSPTPPTHLQDSQLGVVGIAGGGGTGREYVEDKSLASANNRRNENNLGAATSVGISASSSLSHQVGGRWCEGERAFPLKKRRGSFERNIADDTMEEEEKKKKTKVRTKIAKKWVHEDDEDYNDDEEEEEEEEEEEKQRQREDGRVVNGNGAKKRGSVGVIMEGSRCSRVNGRGWRCCQQTLVGYSLCEHHLGKGRLRSMSSVRNRGSTIANKPKKEEESGLLSSSSSSTTQRLKSLDKEDQEDEEKPMMNTKKRKKIGMVKARSISSLLGQTSHLAPAVTLRPSSDSTTHNMVT